MTAFLCCVFLLVGYLARSWRIEAINTRADRARKTADDALTDLAAETLAHAATKQQLWVADLVNNTLTEDLRLAYGEQADDVDQAIALANSPRHGTILDLIAANEAARFEPDSADWGLA